jgi:RNA ligase
MKGRRIEGRAPSLEEALDLAARHKSIGAQRKDDLILFTHLWEDSEALADPRLRELMGIVYDEVKGEVVSRPFHKFFNYREPGLGLGPEAFTRETLGAPDSSVFLAEKVDGHLLQVFPDNRKRIIRFASRHSLENPRLWRLVRQLWTKEHTEAVADLMWGAPKTLLFEVFTPAPRCLRSMSAPA